MEKVKEYIAITEVGSDKLNETVNEYIKKGWQPFGSISSCFVKVEVSHSQTKYMMQFSQAMVK